MKRYTRVGPRPQTVACASITKSEYLNWDGDLVHNSYGTVVFEEEESGPVFSGILDSDGEPIYYLIEKNRIGF